MTPPDSGEREVRLQMALAVFSDMANPQRGMAEADAETRAHWLQSCARHALVKLSAAVPPDFSLVRADLAQRIIAALEDEAKRQDEDFSRGVEEAAKVAAGFGDFGRGLVKAIHALARPSREKPTIAELEAILARPEGTYEAYVLPNGEVRSRWKLEPLAAELRAAVERKGTP